MMHAVINPYDGFEIKSKNEKFWWFSAICFTLPNFLCRACIDWSICYLFGESHCVYPGWTIIIEIFWPITTIHSYTFLLGGSIERAWLCDVTLLNWLLAARTLWLAGFLVYGSPVCRALGISMDFGISGFNGFSRNVRDVRRTNASKVKLMWGWDTTGVRLSWGTENGW